MPLNPACKHDSAFRCTWIMEAGNYQFYCTHGCGYYMAFNPRLYPEGVSFPEWPEMKGKLLPPLRSHEVDK